MKWNQAIFAIAQVKFENRALEEDGWHSYTAEDLKKYA